MTSCFKHAVRGALKLELVWLRLVQILVFLVGYLVMVSPEITGLQIVVNLIGFSGKGEF